MAKIDPECPAYEKAGDLASFFIKCYHRLMEKLANAPIIEAQIGLKLSKPIGLEIINDMADLLKARYPTKKPRFEIKTTINTDNGKIGHQASDLTQQGVQVSSESGYVVILQRDLIIFCSVAKYPGWNEFKKEIEALTNLLSSRLSGIRFSEFFSRYINSIKLETPILLNEYFTFLPNLPSVEPGLTLNGFNYQFVASQNDTGFKTTASFFPRPNAGPTNTTDLVLDLGVSKSIDVMGISAEIWDNFEVARNLKNTLFSGLTTEKLRMRYK
ncbi:MAG: TIGR04255 family protein [Bdellovibrio sp.]